MIHGGKPFVARERTNNKLTQPMHVWCRFWDINLGRIFCANLTSYSPSSLHIRKKNTHALTQPKFHSIFISYAFKLLTWQGLIQLNVSFLPAFPGYSFQRCCGVALSSNTRSQSSLRAAAQTLLRYISVISYKEKMCLIPVGGSLLIGLIIIVIIIIYVFIYFY